MHSAEGDTFRFPAFSPSPLAPPPSSFASCFLPLPMWPSLRRLWPSSRSVRHSRSVGEFALESAAGRVCREVGRMVRTRGEVQVHQNHFHQKNFHQKPLSSKNHFHQKPLSSKTTFIKNHFHQKPLSSKTTFIKKPLSSKTSFIKDQFHRKPFSSEKMKRKGGTVSMVSVCVKASPAEGMC